MSVMISLEIPVQPDKFDEAIELFSANLGDTRAFEGCERLETYIDRDGSRVLLIEQWAAPENHAAYIAWRGETDFGEKLGPVLAGAPVSNSWEVSSI